MTSLPERLRSYGATFPNESTAQAMIYEAANELDRRAEEIQRLGYKLRRVGELVGPPGAWPRTAHMDEVPDRDSDENRDSWSQMLDEIPHRGSGEEGSDEPYDEDQQEPPDVEFTFNPGPFTWLVFAHPDGSVSMRRG